jgi:hypothetical protein
MGCELSIINPDKLVINYLCLQCCADQRQELFASYDVDRKMDGLDDQTTCGHELDANNHRNYPESNETSERDGGQAGNDVKLTGSAPAVYTHGVASGNSFHDHDSREKWKPKVLPTGKSKPERRSKISKGGIILRSYQVLISVGLLKYPYRLQMPLR